MSSDEDIIKGLDYLTFTKIINCIPSCIFFKDTELRYQFSTHFWEQLLSQDIVGKTDLEIRKDKENALLAMEADRNIIRTGKGCNYVIRSDIDGNVSYLELIKEPVFGEDGEVIGIVGLINDVTEKTVLEQKIKELNTKDSLTGLLNRNTGTETIIGLLKNSSDKKAFCLLDLNKFKSINDTYGHQIGDRVLREFGYALKRSIYDGDVAMRLGGDEFIVLLNDIVENIQVEAFISKLKQYVDDIRISEMKDKISFSIGVSIVKGESDFDKLYSETDKNMYLAKKSKSHVVITS